MTAFRSLKEVFCYNVMPFDLKNAGATYQRVTWEYHQVLCSVKKQKRKDHLKHLEVVFDKLRSHQLKMNLLKCSFGVTSTKFLGFIIRHRGIEIDPRKITPIMEVFHQEIFQKPTGYKNASHMYEDFEAIQKMQTVFLDY